MSVLPRSRRWTLPELTLLSRMAASGATAHQIAHVLGRTVAAVRIKAAHQRVNVVLTGRQRPSPISPLLPPPPAGEPEP